MRALLTSFVLVFSSLFAAAGVVQIDNDQLIVDGKPQPQLFGAEVQYFRMRGGFGRNVPRAQVIALWAQALDRVVAAKMNAISFYIPWDFHEYAPGKFDFDGSVDEDGDGQPDYPSRDVKTFIQMILDRGIQHIMIRPGPYVNAEWGFLGFGAIPLWFHEKYPQSHMQNAQGQHTKLYDYANPDLLRESQIWFQNLYQQVLKPYIGAGRPIDFIQLDNETNYMWQSLYNHDYSPSSVARYQQFLKNRYQTLETLNSVHHRQWRRWQDVEAPTVPGNNRAEDQDWYRFADDTIFVFLQNVRKMWEGLGVREPNVMFTLADSYNATQYGLIPNYKWHGAPGKTGLLTVNMYPKTYETSDHPLLNLPFKSDHDVKSAEAASEYYLGEGKHFAMGPEIQAGWWRGIEVTPQARRQTYLSSIGHGLKAMFVYYFVEGDNWQSDWALSQIKPLYDQLRNQDVYKSLPDNQLPDSFWQTLQAESDQKIIVGIDVRGTIHQDLAQAEQLYFDSPLDRNIQPRNHYFDLQEIGQKIVAPYGQWLGRAVEMNDPVCLLKDVREQVPSLSPSIDNVEMNTDWSAGLLAYALHAGINVRVLHWNLNNAKELATCKIILTQDLGESSTDEATGARLSETLRENIQQGQIVVNFLADSLAKNLGFQLPATDASGTAPVSLQYGNLNFGAESTPLFHYPDTVNCKSLLVENSTSSAYRCQLGKGGFLQVGSLFYDLYNSNAYATLNDLPAREQLFKDLVTELKIQPAVQVKGDGGLRVVAFARHVPQDPHLWITAKSAEANSVQARIKIRDVKANQQYIIHDVMSGDLQQLSGASLQADGFVSQLPAFGSTAYWLEPTSNTK